VAVAGLSARLYRDHNIDRQLAFDLRRRAFDVTYASEVGKERATDEDHCGGQLPKAAPSSPRTCGISASSPTSGQRQDETMLASSFHKRHRISAMDIFSDVY
jgi:hypothetical protein